MAELSAQTTDKATVTMPVTRVVLYSSGVGFFEHTGSVDGNAIARFTFKTDQINDVLKSMVLRDFNGGAATAVNYASQDPLNRALRSFAIDLSDKPNLAGLLDRLRGAGVTLMAPQAISGTILGIEQNNKVITQNGQSQIIAETVINLLTGDGLRAVPLSAVSTIKLADSRLNEELNRALALIIDAADTQRKAVDVSFSGNGKRKVAVDYVAEAPVWKTSYRLDLSGATAGKAAEGKGGAKAIDGKTAVTAGFDTKGFIQGWAIVENSSDADWNGINLSLVSGSPVSFTMDLYTPLYVQRPDVRPMVQASVQPRSYDEGMAKPEADDYAYKEKAAPAASAPAPIQMAKRSIAGDLSRAREESDGVETNLSLSNSSSTPGSTASGEKFGEMFNFNIQTPVNLARRQSAMLPLVNQDISAEKVSIYNAGALAHNPLAGARLFNSSGLRLPPGPITIFDGGMYAGDALLETFGPSDKRLISFAIDLDVQVDSSQSSQSEITKMSITQGVLRIQRLNKWTQSYRIQNKAASDKVLLIEHPKTGRELVSPANFMEDTPSLYRFRVNLAKSAYQEFPVVEQQTTMDTVSLLNTSPGDILYYSNSGKPSAALKAALQKVVDAKQKLTNLQSSLNDLNKSKNDIQNEQPRIRANIDTVGRDSPQGQRYLQKLLDGEDKLDKLDIQIGASQDQVKKAQSELEQYLKNLQID